MTMVGKIILGTVQLGLEYGISNNTGKPSKNKSFEIFDTAWLNGIRTLDTAKAYGNAHDLIGTYHKNNKEKRFKVITKIPHGFNHAIEYAIDSYIKELHIDNLYALLFHSFENYHDAVADTNLLRSLKATGKVKRLGVSIYSNEQMEVVIHDPNIDIIQLPFNILDNENQRGELIRKAKDSGKEVHTRSCFLQGLLFMDYKADIPIIKSLRKELKQLKKISENHGLSVSELALGYSMAQKNIDKILIGVDSKTQLEQNIKEADTKLSKELLLDIESIVVENINLLNPSLWNKI